MKQNKQLKNSVRKLVEATFKDERIVEGQVIKSIKILRSLPTAQAIQALSDYLKELKRKQRQHTIYIETAIPLSTVQVKKIKGRFDKKFKITKVVTQVNSDILGGFKLRIGDEIWDESILDKINQVREVISG